MQFWNLLLCSTQEPGVKSWAGGAGKCDFCVCDARQSTQSLGSEDCYFYHNSIWSIQSIIPYLTSPLKINNHLLNFTFHIWTQHLIIFWYTIYKVHISFPRCRHYQQTSTSPSQATDISIDRLDIYDAVTWARSIFFQLSISNLNLMVGKYWSWYNCSASGCAH